MIPLNHASVFSICPKVGSSTCTNSGEDDDNSSDNEETAISGYGTYLIISMISFISILVISKIKKKIKF